MDVRKKMGCLRLTYLSAEIKCRHDQENENHLQVSRDEKRVPQNWQVWTGEKGLKQLKGVRADQNGGNGPGDGLSKYLPVAVMYGLDGDFVVGAAGSERTVGVAIILRGPDAGNVAVFLDGTSGGPTAVGADASAALEGQWIFYTGDVNNFRMESLEGYRKELSVAFDAFIDIGLTGFISKKDKFGGNVIGVGGSFGVGWPMFNSSLNGNFNIGNTEILWKTK